MKKFTAISLLFLLVFSMFSCNQQPNAPEKSSEAEAETNTETEVQSATRTEFETEPPTQAPTLLREIKITAETYLQYPSYSSEILLDVMIGEDGIYINNIPYIFIAYAEKLELIFDRIFIAYAERCDSSSGENQKLKLIEQLKCCNGCYVFEPKAARNKGNKLALYIIDGIYYFVSFKSNGNVTRIHFANPDPDSDSKLKTLTVYVLSYSNNRYSYKLLPGMPDAYSVFDVMEAKSYSLTEMIELLEYYSQNYDIPHDKITVTVWYDPLSSYSGIISDTDKFITEQRELLGLD